MNIFNKLLKKRVVAKNATSEKKNRTEPITDSELLTAILGHPKILEEDALNIPSVARAIELLADIVSMTPVKLYKLKVDKGKKQSEEIQKDIRTKLLNKETGDTLNACQFKRAIVRDYILHGGSYIYINRYRNNILSLHYVKNNEVSILKATDPIFKSYEIRVGGKPYLDYDFIKITRMSKDGITGEGLLSQSSKLLETAYLTLELESNLVRTGGNKKGFLKSKTKLSDASMKALKEAWKKLYSNKNSENVIVLNEGLEFAESSSSSVELQMNEKKQTLDKEIYEVCGIFDDYDKTIKEAVIPILNAIENALDKDLLLEEEKEKGYYFAFDTTNILRGSLKERYEAYKIGLDANFLTLDEVREKEDMKPYNFEYIKLNLGDVFYNTNTKEIFVPNTSTTTSLEKSNEVSKEIIKENEDQTNGGAENENRDKK